jgi:hypothetical protein
MIRPRVLVVVKRTSFERLGDAYVEGARENATTRAQWATAKRTYREHSHAYATTLATLQALGARVRITSRRLRVLPANGVDLVVTVGGDGTFLMASRALGHTTPILGINSAPSSSVGFFCSAAGDTIAEALRAALAGRSKIVHLARCCLRACSTRPCFATLRLPRHRATRCRTQGCAQNCSVRAASGSVPQRAPLQRSVALAAKCSRCARSCSSMWCANRTLRSAYRSGMSAA